MIETGQKHDTGKGWACLVLIGAFTAMLLETGILKCLGALLPALCERFAVDVWVTGLIISFAPGFGTVSCPLAGALSKRYSPRITMMCFGLLSSAGLIIASFAQSLPVLSLALIFTGFSIGAETVTIATLSNYFDKYYDVADAVAHAGVSCGVIIMPLLVQFLFNIYGLRGSLLILGAINLHLVVCGALLIPDKSGKNACDRCIDNDQTKMPRDRKKERSLHEFLIEVMVDYLDLPLFTNIKFLSLVFISTMCGYYYNGWLIYLIPHGLDLGYAPYQAASLSTFGGIGHLLGTINFPLITRVISGRSVLYLFTVTSSASLAMYPLVSGFPSYVGLVLTSVVFGFSRAIVSCAVFKVANIDNLEDRMGNVVSWIFVGYGLGSMCSGFLSGWLYDHTGSYTTSFIGLSIVSLLAMAPQLYIDVSTYYSVNQYDSVAEEDSDSD